MAGDLLTDGLIPSPPPHPGFFRDKRTFKVKSSFIVFGIFSDTKMMISEAWIDVKEFFLLMKNLLQPGSWYLKKQMDREQTDCSKSSQLELQNFDTDSLSSCEVAPETEDALRLR